MPITSVRDCDCSPLGQVGTKVLLIGRQLGIDGLICFTPATAENCLISDVGSLVKADFTGTSETTNVGQFHNLVVSFVNVLTEIAALPTQ